LGSTSGYSLVLMQKLLKSMINSVNPKYIQYLDQLYTMSGENMPLNF